MLCSVCAEGIYESIGCHSCLPRYICFIREEPLADKAAAMHDFAFTTTLNHGHGVGSD